MTALAAVLAVGTAMVLLVMPAYGSGGSLVQVNGWTALLPISIPVFVAFAPLVISRTRLARPARWLAAIVLLGFVVLAGFSIGIFYLPAAATMTAAALLKPAPVEP